MKYQKIVLLGMFLALVIFGDGKQSIADIIGAGGMLSLFILRFLYSRHGYPLPLNINISWGILFLYFIFNSFQSDSIGFSLTATIKWVMAYLMFVLFSFLPEGSSIKSYIQMTLWLVTATLMMSLVVSVYGNSGWVFSDMNLLYPTYGHNQIAGVIVFAFPFVLYRLNADVRFSNIVLFIFFCFGLIFSFARGAWILIFIYLSIYLLVHKNISIRLKMLLITVLMVIASSVLLLSSMSVFRVNKFSFGNFQHLIIKNSVLENRMPYWKQAIESIRDRPLLGAGPGTYYLLSKRYQNISNDYSWYTHSSALEYMSEMGLVGLGVLLVIIYYILRGYFLPGKTSVGYQEILDSVLLTLIYSLYEINLNFIVIWLLFWGAIGILIRQPSKEEDKIRMNYLVYIALIILILFYMSSMFSEAANSLFKDKHVSFQLAPYHASKTLSFLKSTNAISALDLKLINYFHANNPEIINALANISVKDSLQVSTRYYMEKAIRLDPTNLEYHTRLLEHIYHNGNSNEVISQLMRLGNIIAENRQVKWNLLRDHFNDIDMIFLDNNAIVPGIVKNRFGIEYEYSKLLYLLGIQLIAKDPQKTYDLWMMSKNLSPNWSYYYIELASLQLHVLHDSKASDEAISDCLRYDMASVRCKRYMINTPPPGSQKSEIIAH